MTDDIILQRIIRDPKRVFILDGYIVPKIRDDDKKMNLDEEYWKAVGKIRSNPNYPNFEKRLLHKLSTVSDPDLFDYIPEFPLIISNPELFNFLLGKEYDKHHFRCDIFFKRLGVIVELDSAWHKDLKLDQARDRYIKHVWGIDTVRVELGLKEDSEESIKTLDSRFEEVWKILLGHYNRVVKNRILIRSKKPGKFDLPVIINYDQYLVRQFRKEERDTIRICEKYLENQQGFYTMKTVVLYLDKLEKKDKKLFDDQTLFIKERLERLLSYVYEKDLRCVGP